jgi:hypothetical protein
MKRQSINYALGSWAGRGKDCNILPNLMVDDDDMSVIGKKSLIPSYTKHCSCLVQSAVEIVAITEGVLKRLSFCSFRNQSGTESDYVQELDLEIS